MSRPRAILTAVVLAAALALAITPAASASAASGHHRLSWGQVTAAGVTVVRMYSAGRLWNDYPVQTADIKETRKHNAEGEPLS